MFQSKKVKRVFTQATQKGHSSGNYASFNLAQHVGDDKSFVEKNRELLSKTFDKGSKEIRLIFMNQVHGSEVKIVGDENCHSLQDDDSVGDCDAMITQEKNIVLNVMVADCVPVLFYDPKKEVIAVAHAGWRGTAGRIVQKVIVRMQQKYGSKAEDIEIEIGPSISKESYEVGKEVAYKLVDSIKACREIQKEVIQNNKGVFSIVKSEEINNLSEEKYRVDLKLINKLQLINVGIRRENISVSGIDTCTNTNYFSARRQGLQSGRFCGSIMIN